MTVAPMQCPRCAGPFQIESSSAGLQVGCPHCGQPVQIPPLADWHQGDQPPPPPESSAPEPPPVEPPVEPAAPPPPPPEPTPVGQTPSASDTFSLTCPHCQGELQVTAAMSGTAVACPLCQQALQLPDFAGQTPAAPSPTSYQAPSGLSPQEAAFWRMPSAAGQGTTPQSPAESNRSSVESSPNEPPAVEQPASPAPSSRYQYPPGMEPKEVGTRPAPDPGKETVRDTVADVDPMLPPGAGKPKSPTTSERKTKPKETKPAAVDPMLPPTAKKKSPPTEEPSKKSVVKETLKAESRVEPKPNKSAAIDPMLPPTASEPTTAPTAEVTKRNETKPVEAPTVDDPADTNAAAVVPAPVESKAEPTDDAQIDSLLPPSTSSPIEDTKPIEPEPADETPSSDEQPPAKSTVDSLLPPTASTSQVATDAPADSKDDRWTYDDAGRETVADDQPAAAEIPAKESPTADDAKLDSLLPPTASTSEPDTEKSVEAESGSDETSTKESDSDEAAGEKPSSAKDAKLDSLLPPTAPATSPATEPTIDEPPDWIPAAQKNLPPGSILIPTEDGSYTQVREPRRTVGYGDDEVELRQLTPEEKASRRFKRNLVMWVIGTLLLSGALYLLTSGAIF